MSNNVAVLAVLLLLSFAFAVFVIPRGKTGRMGTWPKIP
jgi:hypothetical protein